MTKSWTRVRIFRPQVEAATSRVAVSLHGTSSTKNNNFQSEILHLFRKMINSCKIHLNIKKNVHFSFVSIYVLLLVSMYRYCANKKWNNAINRGFQNFTKIFHEQISNMRVALPITSFYEHSY